MININIPSLLLYYNIWNKKTKRLTPSFSIRKNPEKVACTSRTTYDLLIAFGVADSIDGVYYSLLENEWSSVFDAKADERYSLAYQESYETYIARGVDIVFSPEKGLYMKVTSDIRKLYETKSLKDLVRYMDYVIILSKQLDRSNEFMEKLYFTRYYIDKVVC